MTRKVKESSRRLPLGTQFYFIEPDGPDFYFDEDMDTFRQMYWDEERRGHFTVPRGITLQQYKEIQGRDAGPHLGDVIRVICAYLGRRIRKLMTNALS